MKKHNQTTARTKGKRLAPVEAVADFRLRIAAMIAKQNAQRAITQATVKTLLGHKGVDLKKLGKSNRYGTIFREPGEHWKQLARVEKKRK